MKQKIEKIIYYFQIIIFYISYFILRLFKLKKEVKWVVGVHEIANNIKFIGDMLEDSLTVCLSKNRYYTSKYNYEINISNKYIGFTIRIFYGPILLSYLIYKTNNFLYIWHSGFLLNREFEFKFLKSKNKKIVCLFCGDDIRSPKLTLEDAKNKDSDTFIEYVAFCNPRYLSSAYEEEKKNISRIADNYADLIFNHKLDQISYLQSKQYDFFLTYPGRNFKCDKEKFKNIKNIKIVHAPSSPTAKGTPLVRAAIKKLHMNGYMFEYIELQNMSNEVVLEHLDSTHILLNQFYSVAAGLLGLEGLAHCCCVLQSAEFYNEPKNEPWMITKYYNIYDNLIYLLDNPEKIEFYAKNGYEFSKKYHTNDAVKKYIDKIFKENNIV